jgi:hypothetical protein
MKSPHQIHYFIQRGQFPAGGVACLEWGIRQWEKSLKGKVKFVEDRAFADWHFQFSEVETYPRHIAYCTAINPMVRQIQFDPRAKWALTGWQRFWGMGADLGGMVLHEMGHAFGLRHSVDPTSIMYPQVSTRRIDPAYAAMVLERLNLN